MLCIMLTREATDHRVGFETLDQELPATRLEVTGEVPQWLRGALLRTGPAQFEAGGRSLRHWFDGLAMLHRFTVEDGEVTYANRYLRSKAYEHARREGAIGYREFATDPCRSLFKRVQSLFASGSDFTDNASVNVVPLEDRAVAMTETPLPVAFDPQTLETLGVTDWASEIPGQVTIAHPHYDRGELISYAAHLGPRSTYRLYAMKPGGRPRTFASVPVRRPAYMHSFALTERFVVLSEWPLVVDPLRLATSGRPFIENYRWRPEEGTTWLVVDRRDGSVRARAQGPASFGFHHVNAFDDGSEVVVDVCTYADPSIIDALYLDRLRADGNTLPPVDLVRHRVPLDGSSEVVVERIAGGNLELPRINYARHNTRPYRYTWGVGNEQGHWPHRVLKVDVAEGETLAWEEPHCYPGEPVFVAEPGAGEEDAGVLLSVVLDAAGGTSALVVLDAQTLEERARAAVPHAIPFHFHGNFVAER